MTMGWITWDKTLELGQEQMDADHLHLVALVNQLAKGIVNNQGKEAHDAVLDQLFADIRVHFGNEEKLMAAHAYPSAEGHRAEHVKLIKDAVEYRAKFEAGGEPSISLLYFIDQWLTRHILGSDRELATFLTRTK
jgi:hemerythrin